MNDTIQDSSLSIRPMEGALGADVSGVDLSKPVNDADIAALHRALGEHCVLVFHGQTPTPASLVDFSRKFGPLEHHVLQDYLLPGFPEIYVISNVKEDGKPVGRAGAGQYWHSDLSYVKEPSLGSIMAAVEVPEGKGDTLFANMYEAYEALSEPMKAYLGNVHAVHDFAYTQRTQIAGKGYTEPATAEQLAKTPPVSHPAVRTHPDSGRKALYVNPGMTSHLDGVPPEESRAVLDFLYDHAISPAFVYRHRWQPGDVVFWDNRCSMHCATDDYGAEDRRLMWRTTVKGDAPF
ncbi:MAG: TauD/TfdA family dioxygenase [Rhodospirillales bacterium]